MIAIMIGFNTFFTFMPYQTSMSSPLSTIFFIQPRGLAFTDRINSYNKIFMWNGAISSSWMILRWKKIKFPMFAGKSRVAQILILQSSTSILPESALSLEPSELP